MEYYLAIKKDEIMPAAVTQMDLETVILSEVSQREISYDIPYMRNLGRNYTNKLIYKQKQTHRLREWIYGYQKGKDSQGVGDQHVHTAKFKRDNQQESTAAHGTLINVMQQPGWERSLGENGYIYIYGRVTLLYT